MRALREPRAASREPRRTLALSHFSVRVLRALGIEPAARATVRLKPS